MDTNDAGWNGDSRVAVAERSVADVGSTDQPGWSADRGPDSNISRTKALGVGLKRYYTGEPCVNGHIAERNTQYKQCVECLREADRRRYVASAEKRYLEKDRRRLAKTQVQIAAKTLTEITGIPHEAVETVDANGKKTWQPRPVVGV